MSVIKIKYQVSTHLLNSLGVNRDRTIRANDAKFYIASLLDKCNTIEDLYMIFPHFLHDVIEEVQPKTSSMVDINMSDTVKNNKHKEGEAYLKEQTLLKIIM